MPGEDQPNPVPSPAPDRVPTFELKPFRVGSRATTALSEGGALKADGADRTERLNIDKKLQKRIRRGKAAPQARIDLHGMTADAARGALTAFLFRAHASGKRLVLVITGKGRSGSELDVIPSRTGVLRRSLPEWCRRPPLSDIVQDIAESHRRHGGSGAFYVYLRRAG